MEFVAATDAPGLSEIQSGGVDIVITWVNGQDPALRLKREIFLKDQDQNFHSEAIASTRFNEVGELEYCLKSIFKFAPWFRKIHIITDNQIPLILNQLDHFDRERIEIVDHRIIFEDYQQFLPTFNSLSIEAMMWRIPGLSHHFIYFNDDCMLLQPVKISDFFVKQKLVLRGYWRQQTRYKWRYLLHKLYAWCKNIPFFPKLSLFKQYQENSARLMGFEYRFFHMHHVPASLSVDIFDILYRQNPKRLMQQIRYAIRHDSQHIPVSLMIHYLLKQKKDYIIDHKKIGVAVHASANSFKKIKKRLQKADCCAKVAFICIQSLDEGSPEVRDFILQWLKKRLD